MYDRTHCHHNRVRATTLLLVLTGLVLACGGLMGGALGLVLALGPAVALAAATYFCSDRIALGSVRAVPVSEAKHPELFSLVRELATAMRLPIPAVHVAPSVAPNAFVVGRTRRSATLCVTEGLLALLPPQELRTVLAHELAHVAHRDILVSSLAAALATVLMSAGRVRPRPVGVALFLVLVPLTASLLHLAVRRTREYDADATAARVTGDPMALACALRRLEIATSRVPLPAMAGLRGTAALMIASPFRVRGPARVLSTHPSTRKRVARLEELAGDRCPL